MHSTGASTAFLLRQLSIPLLYTGEYAVYPPTHPQIPQDIAIGALYLSSKLEETELGIRDIINVFHRLTNSQADEEYQPMSYYGPTYYEWKDSLVVAEMQILKRLAFDVYVSIISASHNNTLNKEYRYSNPMHY